MFNVSKLILAVQRHGSLFNVSPNKYFIMNYLRSKDESFFGKERGNMLSHSEYCCRKIYTCSFLCEPFEFISVESNWAQRSQWPFDGHWKDVGRLPCPIGPI